MDGVSVVTLRSVFLVCGDLDKSLTFYQQLGFVLKERKTRSYIFHTGSEVELHLHERLTQAERESFGVQWDTGSSGLVHSYETTDLDSLASSLPPDSVLAGPLETPWGTRILMVGDPDGHRIELRERREL